MQVSLTYEAKKHLDDSYGNLNLAISKLENSLVKYYSSGVKTQKAINRINDYEAILAELKKLRSTR